MEGMAPLSPLLDDRSLPDAELQAMRLDGQLYRLGDAWLPSDAVETPAVRAAAVLSGRSRRLVAELRTAAWVWGAVPAMPRPLELCADVRARARVRPGAEAVVRELVLDDGDVVRLDGLGVTSPLRTAVDLARARDDDAKVVRRLAAIGGFALDDAIRLVTGRRALPGKREAITRLTVALGRRDPGLSPR
jgi:hypothetical protein